MVIVREEEFSATVASGIDPNEGRSLTGLTVTIKVRVVVFASVWPSSTVTVTVEVPLASGVGTRLRVPVDSGVVYLTTGFARTSGLLEIAVTVRV
jgi:hypothetical protein